MKDAYLANRVLTADAVELIHLLYEHGLIQVRLARTSMAGGDVLARAKAVSKILGILGELEGSLDHETGGSISQNLARLYQYMRRRVMEGNLRQQDGALAEVERLLNTLNEGWTAMQRATAAPAQWKSSGQPSPFQQPQRAEAEASHSWSA